jgi:hypothetical protein
VQPWDGMPVMPPKQTCQTTIHGAIPAGANRLHQTPRTVGSPWRTLVALHRAHVHVVRSVSRSYADETVRTDHGRREPALHPGRERLPSRIRDTGLTQGGTDVP